MILEFTIRNFRSIKDEVKFSLLAESSQSKDDNTFEITYAHGGKERLLKSAVIYGANASGKSNVIRAMYSLINFVNDSGELKVGESITEYMPFYFDEDTESAPVELSLSFVLQREEGPVKFNYQVSFTAKQILKEEIAHYPKGQHQLLFSRNNTLGNYELIERVKAAKYFNYKIFDVLSNQLLLSKFGREYPHELMTYIFQYFGTVEVWNVTNKVNVHLKKDLIAEELLLPENAERLRRMNKLLKIADTRIENFNIRISSEEAFQFPAGFPEEVKKSIIEENRVSITTNHKVFKNKTQTSVRGLSMNQESEGTNVLFALGGVILKTLENGGVLLFDELDNSLHPKLCKFLIRLFNNSRSNPKNAQLIFATHEVTLLDKEIFRKDQVWFTEKDKYGVTNLFSMKEFDGVREDTPFDKWYMSGKFGGTPKIKEIDFIFDHA